MDDFSVYCDSFDHSLKNIQKVLQRCIETNLSLSNEKCYMMLNEGIVLGHHISSKGIEVDQTKIQIIVELQILTNQKDVRSFLGYASYLWRFIANFSNIALPLFKRIAKDVTFDWNGSCQTAFEKLKEKLSTAPVLRGHNWTLSFHISTDASDLAVGASLGQK